MKFYFCHRIKDEKNEEQDGIFFINNILYNFEFQFIKNE